MSYFPKHRFLNLPRDSNASIFALKSLPFVSTAGRGEVSSETAPAYFKGLSI